MTKDYPMKRRHPPRQDSLREQMKTVHLMATNAGCYDAADAIEERYLR